METKSALGKRINVHSNFWRDIEPPGFICQTYSVVFWAYMVPILVPT